MLRHCNDVFACQECDESRTENLGVFFAASGLAHDWSHGWRPWRRTLSRGSVASQTVGDPQFHLEEPWKCLLVYGLSPSLAPCSWELGAKPCWPGRRPAFKAIRRTSATPQCAWPHPGNPRLGQGPLPSQPASIWNW